MVTQSLSFAQKLPQGFYHCQPRTLSGPENYYH